MSIEGRIAVIERVIQEGEIVLKGCRAWIKLLLKALPDLEQSLESNKKKLEELRNEARKDRLQQNSGS